MTEEIIIDGIDVSGCSLLNKKIKVCMYSRETCNGICDYGCYARNEIIERLEQENKRLRKANEISIEKVTVTAEAKRLQELEQENKELKNIIKIHDSTKYDYYKLMKENEEWHIKYAGCNTANSAIQEENNKYRSALEEIRNEMSDKYQFGGLNGYEDFCKYYEREYSRIIDKINEVLNDIQFTFKSISY